MSSGANFFLKKTLGEDFLQSLEKFELWKQGTRSVIDHEEIKTALKIVPRTLMAYLIRNLTPMNIGDHKDIPLQVANRPEGVGPDLLKVDKHERDVYSGEIISDNKKIAEFKFRSAPGVGLVVMTAFELYEVDDLDKQPESPRAGMEDMQRMVSAMIEERLALNDLVGRVVDNKLSQRDAIQQLILAKITEDHKPKHTAPEDVKNLVERKAELKDENKKLKKKLALNEFLEGRKQKLHKKEYQISLSKNEDVSCPDCHQSIFKNEAYSGCVCMGENMDSKVHFTKSEDGVKVRFGKGWDPENIEMLLEVLRGKRG
jgi:hypothetical protein